MTYRIHRHGTIDSTSERAFAAIADGTARDGDVHVAEAQTRGRGRLGRSWHSAPGEGLYVSVVLMPERALPPAALTIAVGLAVHDAVTRLGVADARLKWPNDVVVPSRGDATTPAKLSGILVETRGLSLERPHYVVGIGVNVAQRSFPPELLAERPVTSLASCGVTTSVENALAAILGSLPTRIADVERSPRALARDYAFATGCVEGARVEVDVGEECVVGSIRSFDLERGIVVATDHGGVRAVPLEIVRALRPALARH